MPADPPALPRRAAVIGVVAASFSAALAACTKGSTKATPTGSAAPGVTRSPSGTNPVPSTTPSRPSNTAAPALLSAAIAREVSLLTAYDAVLARLPAAAAVLADFRSHHQAHLDRLRSTSGAPPASPPPTPRSPTAGPATAKPTGAPAGRVLIDDLARAESAAAAAGATACAQAGPTSFALMLAEIAGCEAQHGALLPIFPAPVAP